MNRWALLAIILACLAATPARGDSLKLEEPVAGDDSGIPEAEAIAEIHASRGVEFEILKDERVPWIKRSLDVALEEMLSRAARDSLSEYLVDLDPAFYEQTYIIYRVPDAKGRMIFWTTGCVLRQKEDYVHTPAMAAAFDTSDYGARAELLCDYMKLSAALEVALLGAITIQWEQSIQLQQSLDRIARTLEVEPSSSDAVSEGVYEAVRVMRNPGFASRHDTCREYLRMMRNPPDEYVKVHDLLLDLYAAYSELVSLAQAPRGSLISFQEATRSLERQVNMTASKIGVLY